MASSDWQSLASAKREANAGKIPAEWQLAPQYMNNVNSSSDLNVLRVFAQCGILSLREIEITESLDATALLEKLTTGQYR